VLGPAAIIAILTAIGLYLKNRPKNGDTRGKSR
jgi:hypothetical protein